MTKKNKVLYNMFKNMVEPHLKDPVYTIKWNDGTSTTKGPSGKVITYKNK